MLRGRRSEWDSFYPPYKAVEADCVRSQQVLSCHSWPGPSLPLRWERVEGSVPTSGAVKHVEGVLYK